jgi:hypothetical protein
VASQGGILSGRLRPLDTTACTFDACDASQVHPVVASRCERPLVLPPCGAGPGPHHPCNRISRVCPTNRNMALRKLKNTSPPLPGSRPHSRVGGTNSVSQKVPMSWMMSLVFLISLACYFAKLCLGDGGRVVLMEEMNIL